MNVRFCITVSLILISISLNATAENKKKPFEEIIVPSRIAECIAELPPTINEIQNTALAYARLTPDDLTRWKKNIKYSALLPRLQFGYERKVTDGIDVGLDDSVSVTSAGVNVGPTAGGWGRNLDRNNNIEVQAIWYLDELVFNREDLSISNEARAQISARRNLLGEITDDYVELKRLITIYMTNSPEANENKGMVRLEMERLIGRLDSQTNGWFNRNFKWKGVKCE